MSNILLCPQNSLSFAFIVVDHEIQAEVMLSLYRLFSKEFVRAFLLAVVVIVGGGGVDAIIVIFAIEFDGVLFFLSLVRPNRYTYFLFVHLNSIRAAVTIYQ